MTHQCPAGAKFMKLEEHNPFFRPSSISMVDRKRASLIIDSNRFQGSVSTQPQLIAAAGADQHFEKNRGLAPLSSFRLSLSRPTSWKDHNEFTLLVSKQFDPVYFVNLAQKPGEEKRYIRSVKNTPSSRPRLVVYDSERN